MTSALCLKARVDPLACILLRFTFGVTPAHLLAASLVAEQFLIHILACIQALVGIKSRIEHATALQRATR